MKTRVFLCWSGDESRQVATLLRDWLPNVLHVEPWMSTEDIPKGGLWRQILSTELNSSSYGIVALTANNLDSPWVHWEAGALALRLSGRVCPYLLRLPGSAVRAPLADLQLTEGTAEDTLRMIRSINAVSPEGDRRTAQQVDAIFAKWWPDLDTQLRQIRAPVQSTKRTTDDLLEEILARIRSIEEAGGSAGLQDFVPSPGRQPGNQIGRDISDRQWRAMSTVAVRHLNRMLHDVIERAPTEEELRLLLAILSASMNTHSVRSEVERDELALRAASAVIEHIQRAGAARRRDGGHGDITPSES